MTDLPQSLDDLLREHKRCPQCGHANRLAAKVCVNCGFRFPLESIRQDETVAVPVNKLSPTARPPNKPIRAKTCPDCGTVNDLDAKFCPMCGHRFSTDFSKTPSPPSIEAGTRPAAPQPLGAGEPPIVQMPSTGTVLVTPATPPPVILPPLIKPPSPPAQNAPPAPVQPDTSDDSDSLDGAPAPDLTDVDLDRLRRRDRRF